MRGRKPKSPPPKLAPGTNSSPAGPGPAPPDWLDDEGRGEWARMAPVFHAAGRLTEADVPALALYCDAFSRYQLARKELETYGVTLNTDLGGTKANPAAAVAKEASATMAKILGAFGGTPADRKKLGASDAPKANPFEAYKAKWGKG